MLIISLSIYTAPHSSAAQDESLRELEQLIRAGEDGKALERIEGISGSIWNLESFGVSLTADFLIGREKWELATRFLEVFPQARPGWGYILVAHKVSEANGDPKKLDEIENWIEKRMAASPRTVSKFDRNSPDYWTKELFGFAERAGRSEEFFSKLEQSIKKAPGDLDGLKRYLALLNSIAGNPRSMGWLPDAVYPALAVDHYRIAELLKDRYPAEAIIYLNRAYVMKFLDVDKKAIRDQQQKYSGMPMSEVEVNEKMFSVWIRSMLVECYKRVGQPDKAHGLLVGLSKELGGKTPHYALTESAGSIQSQTNLHPLEQEIVKAEPANENSRDYWAGRAAYYRGRKDADQEKAALLKVLELTPANENPSENESFARRLIVNEYAMFLRRIADDETALDYLWGEYDKNPDQRVRKSIIGTVLNCFENPKTPNLKPADPRLLKFLEDEKIWESRLIWKMALNAESPAHLDRFWQTLERLASGNGFRERCLGWVMNRCNDPKRSLPLLQGATTRLKDAEQTSAFFNLFESYLDLHDWQNAENIWPQASGNLTDNERPEWLGRIALAAAKAGDKSNAMRLWKKKDEVDLAELGQLNDLVEAGMRSEMRDYYRAILKQKPTNAVPSEAIKMIDAVKE